MTVLRCAVLRLDEAGLTLSRQPKGGRTPVDTSPAGGTNAVFHEGARPLTRSQGNHSPYLSYGTMPLSSACTKRSRMARFLVLFSCRWF